MYSLGRVTFLNHSSRRFIDNTIHTIRYIKVCLWLPYTMASYIQCSNLKSFCPETYFLWALKKNSKFGNIEKLQYSPRVLLLCWFDLQPETPKTAGAKWQLQNSDLWWILSNPFQMIFLSTRIVPGLLQQCIVLRFGTVKGTLLTRSYNLIRFSC